MGVVILVPRLLDLVCIEKIGELGDARLAACVTIIIIVYTVIIYCYYDVRHVVYCVQSNGVEGGYSLICYS